MYKFTLTEIIKEFTHIEDKYGTVEVKKEYVVYNYDDLQNLILTLVDFGPDTMQFEIKKEVTE